MYNKPAGCSTPAFGAPHNNNNNNNNGTALVAHGVGVAVEGPYLEKDKPYPIMRAERFQTKYGMSILLTVKAFSSDAVRELLPKRVTLVFSDADIDQINNERIRVNLIYHGTCDKTSA
jgi:hypothetical protein